jgi:hypothetical protein
MSDDTRPTIPIHGRKAAPKGFDRAAYDRAARGQQQDRHLTRTPIPARITIALDIRGLDGDQVDRDLGVWHSPEGLWEDGTAVDRWEDGTLTPTREQILALCRLTGHPWRFFYTPIEHHPERVFICERGRRHGRGLTVVTSTVDDKGVLHREFSDPGDEPDTPPDPKPVPKPPAGKTRKPRNPQGSAPRGSAEEMHTAEPDGYGFCTRCTLPVANRRWHRTGEGV